MNVSLSFLTVRNGKTDNPAGGSAIVNFGTLDMAHCTLSGNTTSNGAALSNRGGELTFNKSAVVDNVGGGILNRNGHAEINNSTVARNSGTGIASVGDLNTIKVAFSTVWRNTGGGVSEGGGSATLRTVKVLDNSAVLGGGIFVGFGSLILNQSIVSGNSATLGGGIANRSGGDLTIRNSTISDNSASQRGGGIFNDANTRADAILHATNSTISGNSAAVGGGLYNAGFTAVGDVTLLEITIAHNTASGAGGGIRQESDEAILGLRNSLVALNSGASGPDVSNSNEGSPIFARFSLIGDGSGSGITSSDGNQVGSHSSPINPKLGPLADNGGPTPTHALLSGSPAIDAAGSGDCTNTDQRGVGRPQGSACDIGSYEKE